MMSSFAMNYFSTYEGAGKEAGIGDFLKFFLRREKSVDKSMVPKILP